ncbi:MAG: hypothetical protein QOI86_4388, partial [Actinomycetota bacterium]|nr:hypothetical protein [Actinomycetota bacterium]
MFTNLDLVDFKAFHRASVELRPLTILVGENNSGKSSLLAAIRLLAQTVQGSDPTIPLAFNGHFGDFGAFRDVVHGHHRGRPFSIGLTAEASRRPGSRTQEQDFYSFISEFKYRTQRRET